jgi:glycosyltransferase involved in cell wall biosynthesis
MAQIKQSLESMGHKVDILGNSEQTFHMLFQNRYFYKKQVLPLLLAKLSHTNLAICPGATNTEANRYAMELAAIYFGLEKYDIIHTHDAISTKALRRVKPPTTPLVSSLHGSLAREILLLEENQQPAAQQQNAYLWKYYKAIEYYSVLSSDKTIASSQWLKNILVREYGVPNEKLAVFQYGMDNQAFIQQMQAPSLIERPRDKKVILFTGRLVPLKGLDFLLYALSRLKKSRQDWVCWIVGSGDKLAHYELLSANLDLREDVVFFGGRKDIPQLINLCDIYVQPSLQDNQPFSVIEAQIAGKPVVSSDAGGLPEMVQHGMTGMISPHGESEILYQHLLLLLDNDALRRTLGSNAKQWGLRHWALQPYIARTMAVYDEVLKMGVNRAMNK